MIWLLVPLFVFVSYHIFLVVMLSVGLRRSREPVLVPERPSVSVVIPAHNEEEALGRTLESLSQQTYEGEVEFVIVNDRSEDATRDIIESFVGRDSRFRLVDVERPGERFAPKVNAVNTGIERSKGEIILTSDADCRYPENWVTAMASHFAGDVAMVIGYVESSRKGDRLTPVQRFESIDWLSLMLVSKALTHFGWKFASSANNQGYRRSAFDAIGGFGAGGRAPSGDEDLLVQRMGRLEDRRIVYASEPGCRVLTDPMPGLVAFLHQRRRWVSRYQHAQHYRPAFLLSIAVLGLQSFLLSISVLLTPFFPTLAPYVFGLWAVKIGAELSGMHYGMGLVDRRDLGGFLGLGALGWALVHPFFIAYICIWSLIRSGEWRAGAKSYRRRFWKRRFREWFRKMSRSLDNHA